MKILVTLFSVIVKSRQLRHCRHLDSGFIYIVDQNHDATTYLFLYFSVFFLFNFHFFFAVSSFEVLKCLSPVIAL